MSAQHRHDAQDRASEPVEWGAWSFDPASEAHQRPQETSFPFPGSSPLCTRAGPEPDCMRLAEILRESEERFRGLTEAAFEGILIHEDGRILGANQRLAEMLGYELSELIGMEAPRLVAPEWRDFVLQTRLSGCEEPYEAVGLRKDGSTFLAELCGKCVRYDGRTVRVAAIRDITERKRAEEALRESDKKFRHVLDSSRDMVYCLNLKTFTYDYLSPSCKEVLGYSPEEFAALGFMGAGSLVHPDDVQRVLENFAQVRTHPYVEYRFRHKELGYRWMSDSRSVVFDDKGGAAVVGALRDITKRKRAEEALRQAELRYRFLFEQAPAMYVITRSENVRPIITDCNELFLTTLGYPRVEVLGRPLADFYAPLSRDRLLEHGGYQRALEGRFCAEGRQLVTRDGRVVETVLRAVPEFDDGGRTIGTRATYLNITERKRAEEALRESEERFRRLCDATIEGIVIHDGRKILDANQALAAMLGYDVSEIVGRDGLEFVAPGYRGLVEQNILSGYEAPYEALCLKRDGSTFPAEVRGKVIPYDGRLARVTAVRDITERKRAEAALRNLATLPGENPNPIIRVARNGTVLFANQSSRPLLDLWGCAEGASLPSEPYRQVERALTAGKLVTGETICGDRTFLVICAPIAERDYVNLYGVDITERKRAEAALRESEERFRLIAQATSDAIYDYDLVTGSVWWSEGIRTLFGYARNDVGPGITWWYEHIHSEDRDGVASRTYAATLNRVQFWVEEYRFRRSDGSYAYVADRGYFIYDGVGKPLRVIGGLTDISERKRAEEALRDSEERFRLIAQATSDAIWDWDLVTGRVWRGEGMLSLFGHAPSETEPRITWWYDRIHPEDKDRVVAGLHAAIQDGWEFWDDEYRFQRADGSYACVQDRGYVIHDAYGSALRMTGGMTDITERKRAEEALRESEKRYRLLAENVTDVIWTMDTNLRTTHISPSVTHLRGYSVEEAMAQTPEEVATPASFDVAAKVLAEELAAESAGQSAPTRSRTLELEVTCKDGSTVWAEATMTFLRGEDGRVVGILGVSRDISERRRAQTALEESEKRYRLLAENATDIIWIRDLDLRVVYANPAVTRIRGYSIEEVMAQPLEEVLTPASLELARKALAEELAEEQAEERDLNWWRTLELEHRCKDGSTVWLEVRVTALRDEDGRMVGILGVSRDISERRRAQTALEESEKRYRLLAENATDIIWITDSNLRAVYINPAVTRIRGFSVEEVMAHTPNEALTPASVEVARRALAEALEEIGREDSRRWWTLELEHTCKDGSTVWLETTATALCDEQGRVVQFLGASRDISERKRAEEALQEAREELESRVERRMRRGSAYGLTFRELTVLHLVVAGKSDKEIAAVLGISALTASKHLGNILRKMGAASRTEAGVRALREGLLDSREARL